MKKILFSSIFRRRVATFATGSIALLSGLATGFAQPVTLEDPAVNAADFRVTTFASGLDFPLGMVELPDGSILVTISEGSNFFNTTGKLVRFVDADADGVADDAGQVVADSLPGAQTAIRLGGDLIFVTGQRKPITIFRMGETPSDPLTLEGRIIVNYEDNWYHPHTALELRPTPGAANNSYDLFFQLGSTENFEVTTQTTTLSNINVPGATGPLEGDAAYMITIIDDGENLSAENLTQIAAGLRNAAGFTFHPTTGDLYFQDNGIDGLDDDVGEAHSADELNFIAREEIGNGTIPDFGFPHNYTRYRTGEVVGGEGVQPLVAFQPLPDPNTGRESEGPNDITYAPPGFPEGLNNGIFLGFHGQFNSGGLANEENPVVFANPETGEYFHFIWGQKEGLGHPDGLLATRDSLFVADMTSTGEVFGGGGTGVIYQIQAVSDPIPPDLAVRKTGSALELRWDRGALESADEVAGPWSELDDVFSPLLVDPTEPRKFYRAGY